jgi:phytoene/squalene synthetase
MTPSLLSLAASITKEASKQTYYTIRFLVDRRMVADAYCAYAYFRWVDDTIDAPGISRPERLAFVNRQSSLLESIYQGGVEGELSPEEQMLLHLIQNDTESDSGLQAYLRNMMAVMVFDADRRGRIISQAELESYTHSLASAVTEAMHYFIGHRCFSPHDETRYLAVTAAHITHMLRDTFDDFQDRYYNIPAEILETRTITAQELTTYLNTNAATRRWVQRRVQLARAYFKAGKLYLNQLESWRCKLAGYAYAARFEWLLDTIEQDNFLLRPQYRERHGLRIGLQMLWRTLLLLTHPQRVKTASQIAAIQPHSLKKL